MALEAMSPEQVRARVNAHLKRCQKCGAACVPNQMKQTFHCLACGHQFTKAAYYAEFKRQIHHA